MGFGKKKKATLLDQANGYVEAARPHIESAVDRGFDFVQDTALPALHDAKEKATPALQDARAMADQRLTEVRDAAAPRIADAKKKAAPVVAAGAAKAAGKAHSAKKGADSKIATIKGEAPKKGRKLRRLLIFSAVAGGVAVAAKKLQDNSTSDNWQSSYKPTPPPGDRTATSPTSAGGPMATPAAPPGTSPQGDPLTDPLPDDTGGASPDEALADSAETSHPVSSPDQPAEVIDIDGDQPKP